MATDRQRLTALEAKVSKEILDRSAADKYLHQRIDALKASLVVAPPAPVVAPAPVVVAPVPISPAPAPTGSIYTGAPLWLPRLSAADMLRLKFGIPPNNPQMSIGGDHSLRGPKAFWGQGASYSPTISGTATNASVAAIHTMRDNIGVGTANSPKIMRIPAGTVTGQLIANKAYQIWEFHQGDLTAGSGTSVVGDPLIQADNVTFRGGTFTGRMYGQRNQAVGHNFTWEHFFGSVATEFVGRNNITIRNFNCTLTSDRAWWFYANTLADGQCGPVLIEHGIWTRGAGTVGQSMVRTDDYVAGRHSANWSRYNDVRIYNCWADMGTDHQPPNPGHYGLEFFSGDDNEIAYCDLRGGGYLTSTPRNYRTWIHHNLMNLNVAASASEYAGDAGVIEQGGTPHYDIHVGSIFEFNQISGTRTHSGIGYPCAVDMNNGPHGITVRFNKVSQIKTFIYRDNQTDAREGGAHVIENNCVAAGIFVEYPSAIDETGYPSTRTNNDADGCGF